MTEPMIGYLGWWRDTEVPVLPRDLGCGAGEVTCFECGGSGDWTQFHPEQVLTQCVCCKGTGRVLISI